MKSLTLTYIFAIAICFNAFAQEEKKDQSLQESLNKALNDTETKDQSLQESFNLALMEEEDPTEVVNNFEANVDFKQVGVQLKWKVNPPSYVKEYIIEKSADKSIWVEVATISGTSNDHQMLEYLHMDYLPLENLSYYRVVQVSKNGKEEISNIVPVNYIITDYQTAGINLFPGVSENDETPIVNIAFEEIFEKEILMVIRDKNGQEYYSKVELNIEDETLIATPLENEIPTGDYLVIASSENQLYSQNISVKN